MSKRNLRAEGCSYAITDRYGIVRNVERRSEKLIVNCGGSARSIETLNSLITAQDGNDWHISTGAAFSVEPGNRVKVSFIALDGGAPHAAYAKNIDTGASWWWSMKPLLPNFRRYFWATAMLLAVWMAIWSLVGEPSRRLAPYAFGLGTAPIVGSMTFRFFRRRRLTAMLRAEMESATP
jgi:hypothetical protein